MAAFWDTHCGDCGHDLHPMNVCSATIGGDQNGPDYCPCTLDYAMLAADYQRRPMTLYARIGPPISVLDEVRSRHRRQDVATPDDAVDSVCSTCYIFDESWPCAVARLVTVIDEHIYADRALLAARQARNVRS